MAIDRGDLGVMLDGLGVYRRLIEAILDEAARLQRTIASGTPDVVPLGREWEQVLRDLHGVVDAMGRSQSQLLWADVVTWIRQVAVFCADLRASNALGHILTLIESAWNQELAAPQPDSAVRQDLILLHLSEIGLFYRHIDQDGGGPASDPVELAYTRSFVNVIKRAIDAGKPETTKVALEYYLRGGRKLSADDNPVTAAGLLSLYAWILYLADHGESVESFDSVCQFIRNSFDRRTALLPILLTTNQLENEMGWQWWELRGRGPMQSGTIEIGSYLTLAFLMVAGVRLAWEPIDSEDERAVALARRLVDMINSVENGHYSSACALVGATSAQLVQVKEHLLEVVEAGDVRAEEKYAAAPVDPHRVGEFRRAVQAKLETERKGSLIEVLRTEPSGDSPIGKLLGFDTLVPRWQFADAGFSAPPEHFANELVGGLVRGEQERILEVAVDLTGTDFVDPEVLPATVRREIESSGRERPVVVTNSYRAHAALTGRPFAGGEEVAGPALEEPVVRVYDDREPYVTLLFATGTPRVTLATPSQEVEGDEPVGLGVILGVSELSKDAMDEIVRQRERTRLEEARLRGSLRVRLLERLYVTLEGEERPKCWRLPEDAW
jgi:hypothetical protein